MVKVRTAIVSVSNKKGVARLCKELFDMGVKIVSTGGTAKHLRDSGVNVKDVSEVTDFPEILGGRVKTLHPNILAGILADKNNKKHLEELSSLGINTFDLVVCNLYPFKETIDKPDVTIEKAVEQIDIGGVTLIRAAAKNHGSCAVVVDPSDYKELINNLKENKCNLSDEYLLSMAKKAFYYTADYNDTIYEYFRGGVETFPELLTLHFEKIQDLRYGENPHQKASFYRELDAPKGSTVSAQQLHGKELSFNNILDLDSAWKAVLDFKIPACTIIKHTNPCGVAVGKTPIEAYKKALASDSLSAFGGIVALNKEINLELAKLISDHFFEIVAAPGFHEEALEILTQKKNLRIMYMEEDKPEIYHHKDIRRICGGALLQDYDVDFSSREEMEVVSKRKPTEEEWENLLFSWKVVKHVKSNAIVLVRNLATVGIGAGQMSRIDAVKIAIRKSQKRTENAVLASDAFFPFSDSVEEAAKAGVSAIIQPGGSIRDQESIDACDNLGLTMVFTGKRHFRH